MKKNYEDLISDFSKLKIEANSDGLISGPNVLIAQLPSTFYNNFSLKLLQSIRESLYKAGESAVEGDLQDYAAGLLENAAAECGYHTSCGIINSKEFASVMENSVENPEDILYGLFAIATAWGWGDLKIAEIIPPEKLVLRAHNYYESDIKSSLKYPQYFAYMLKGVSRAFMDIVYGSKCPPTRLGGFKSVQTKGIELGDEYGEFVVTKA